MICSRCGDEFPNTLPLPYALVVMSGLGQGQTWAFCIDRCAAVIATWLDHSWEPGQDVPVVPIDANGQLADPVGDENAVSG